MHLQDKKRITIGFQISNLHDSYSKQLLMGIMDVAKERGVNLLVFPGESPGSTHGFEYQSNVIYDYINKSNVDALVFTSSVISEYISGEEFRNFFRKYHSIPMVSIAVRVEGVPGVFIHNRDSVMLTMKHLVEVHNYRRIAFIKGSKNNPESTERYRGYMDALEKYSIGYDDDLVIEGAHSGHSQKKAVEELLAINKKRKIDAIVASNDRKALDIIKQLEKKGIRVPKDIAVAGFDDSPESRFSIPSLTTIKQPLYQQARVAMEMAVNLAEGRNDIPESLFLPTELIIRASCGCMKSRLEETTSLGGKAFEELVQRNGKLREEKIDLIVAGILDKAGAGEFSFEERRFLSNAVRDLLFILREGENDIENRRRFIFKANEIMENQIENNKDTTIWLKILPMIFKDPGNLFRESFILASELCITYQAIQRIKLENRIYSIRGIAGRIVTILNTQELMKILREELPGLGIKSCYVVLYENFIKHQQGERWQTPGRKKLIMGYDEFGALDYGQGWKGKFPREFILPPEVKPASRQLSMFINPIYFMDEQIGYIIMELTDIERSVYELLITQISSSIKSSSFYMDRENSEKKLTPALRDLRKSNNKLKEISVQDELTGLYNRRGFQSYARNSLLLSERIKKDGLVLYLDLDGLKIINDKFGHNEGDFAIKKTAEILRNTFRKSDIIGRLGGDEFAVLSLGADSQSLRKFEERLEKNLERINLESGKPFAVSMSMGATFFRYNDPNDIDNLLSAADRELYDRKKAKPVPDPLLNR